ncbi:MAG: carbamoyltransferase HypF [Candidatus Hodarchaeales archaeon]
MNRTETREILLKGRIQGIGFRPFVYRIAVEAGCNGWVQNIGNGVRIKLQGSTNQVERFMELLYQDKPSLAVYDDVISEKVHDQTPLKAFKIIKSSNFVKAAASYIPPDLAMCGKCLDDMIKGDRPGRAAYPFTSCVDCGPRYSVIRQLPYDRPFTEMDRFPLCKECLDEYTSPADRRYHAQTTCCRTCGPRYRLYDSKGEVIDLENRSIPSFVMKLIREGNIIAIKGIGGCHLACNPYDDNTIHRLREKKGDRERKPFALMSRDLETISQHAYLQQSDKDLLISLRRPIVLLPRKKTSSLSSLIAPDLYNIGFMLPYTGMHYLLLDKKLESLDQIVMTSGNPSHEPILTSNDEIIAKLGGIADYFLLHDRNIYQRIDDSVIKAIKLNEHDNTYLFIRRSRGWVPEPIKLPVEFKYLRGLGLGAEMHNTPSISLDGLAFPGQYNGDIKYAGNYSFYLNTIDHILKLFGLQKKDLDVIASDMHPEYASTRYSTELSEEIGIPVSHVQHHHSHACSVMTEHGKKTDEEVIAVILDGTGYGPDGHIWGGEIFRCSYSSFERVAHLEEVLIPGGDAAVHYPGRMLSSHVFRIYPYNVLIDTSQSDWLIDRISTGLPGGFEEFHVVLKQLRAGLNCIPTSSTGRFLDSLSFLLGLCTKRSYEGEPAIILESAGVLGKNDNFNPLQLNIETIDGRTSIFKTTELIKDVIGLIKERKNPYTIAYWAQAALAKSLASFTLELASADKLDVVISGGVFYNSILQQEFADTFNTHGIELLNNRNLPSGDGCISTGQLAASLSNRI